MATLVTGGAGFIGSHLCEALLNKGTNVVCVDDFNDYYSPKFKNDNIRFCLKNKNFRLYKADIANTKNLEPVFKKNKIEKIVHLAARAGVRASIQHPLLYGNVNVLGTLNMLILSTQYKIKNFIFGSSSSVYGNAVKVPFSEKDETSKPISPYAATKKAAELICYTYSQLYNIPVTCLRLFTVYGPRGRPDMAPYKFTELIYNEKELPIFGDGTSKRDYTYVADIVNGIMNALDNEFEFEIINLGNSNPVELNKFVAIIEENVGKKAKIKRLPIQPGEVKITYSDIRKAKKLLDWEPKIKINEGMNKFIDWYKNERA